MTTSAADAEVDRIVRAEYARVVATLVRRFGDVDVAEEAAAEALLVAVRTWRRDGLPPNPGGWLVTTAGNRAIDRIRRDSARHARQKEAAVLTPEEAPDPLGAVDDDRLRLIFMCCHPALAVEARVALTLRLVAGLSMAEIASAFVLPETTMAQRLTRAKRKIKAAKIPFGVPFAHDLPSRVSSVMAVIYLVFNQGYLATSGDAPIREDLCAEAIRLSRLVRELLPDEPETTGLLALLILTDARRPARFEGGTLVPLTEQDRDRWLRPQIAEGHALVRECLRVQRPGYYQILAAINAVHTDGAATDWRQVLALYDQLSIVAPSPVVALNRAVALAEVEGPAEALAVVDALDLVPYHAWHATRADLLRRLDRRAEAAQAYEAAIALADNPAERAFLEGRRALVTGGSA
ncbi:RNA polymerase sigma factor [Cryptosporangium aurantiacum]|uniref:RNA polymerase, sigma subunit, ECF family n=1 Tax=Cryptosporangium aurantiacum TaxID=134849 RepID=A0A1M7HGB4_9ACTN|nr:sigma-70 family RNA polymerase sigma factor [Cryptosporangium aurantiacum]SHM27536.1 RNA polymerase, sigma subunit, ECF family [Cryptosporangium aurantiacum]